MAAIATKYGQKYLQKHAKNQAAQYFKSDSDVYYVFFDKQKRDGRIKTERRRKKRRDLPEELTEAEKDVFIKALNRAYSLDQKFNLCGFTVGWSAVVGIIPVIGDFVDFFMAFLVYRLCCATELLHSGDKSQMALYMAADFGIGLVPIIGDIADGVFKCNTRNVAILGRRVEKVCENRRRQARQMTETQANRVQGGPPPTYRREEPRQPEAVRAVPETRGGRGWFGGRKDRDAEMGQERLAADIAPPKPPRR